MLRALARRYRDAAPRAASPRSRRLPGRSALRRLGTRTVAARRPTSPGRGTPPCGALLAPALSWSSAAAATSRAPLHHRRRPPDVDPAAALRPAILVCTSKVVPKHQRRDYDACRRARRAHRTGARGQRLSGGRHSLAPGGHISPGGSRGCTSRGSRRCGTGRPPETDRRTGLAHVRHGGAPKTETVAVVFSDDDLERWRRSRRRGVVATRWTFRRGWRRGGRRRVALEREVSSIDVDDGSLGGWLPADAEVESAWEHRCIPTPAPSGGKCTPRWCWRSIPCMNSTRCCSCPRWTPRAWWFAALSQPAKIRGADVDLRGGCFRDASVRAGTLTTVRIHAERDEGRDSAEYRARRCRVRGNGGGGSTSRNPRLPPSSSCRDVNQPRSTKRRHRATRVRRPPLLPHLGSLR